MEIGPVPKVAMPVVSAVSRIDAMARAASVRTELGPEASPQALQAAEDRSEKPRSAADRSSGGADGGPGDTAPPDEPAAPIAGHFTIDVATRTAVFQAIDQRDGFVVVQVPDEALLRARVYEQELRRTATARGMLDVSA